MGLFFCDKGICYSRSESQSGRIVKMAGVYKLVGTLSWWLGVLCLIAGGLTKVVKPTGFQVFGSVSAHSLLFFAEVLFLCTLATWAAEKRDAKP